MTEMSSYWPRPGGHVISINQGPLFPLWGMSPRSSSRLTMRYWMHERPGMKWKPVQWLCRGEVIMTSYQELTAEGESSPLFTGCCRAKEVINRDLGGRTHPELCRRVEEGELEAEVASGFNTPHPRYLTLPNSLTLCTSLDNPPPPPPPPCETLEGFSTPACPHSSRVPWRRRAQGQQQGSPGRGRRASNINDNTPQSAYGSLPEHFQIYCRNGPEIHVAVGSSAGSDRAGADVDVNSKTFEWMRVKRSQHRAGEFFLSREAEHERRERATGRRKKI